MRNILVVIVCLSLMLSGGCSLQETAYSDFDKSADFTVYKTFAWLPSDTGTKVNSLYDNPILEKNIKAEVEQELRRRGYTLNNINPDLLIKVNLMVENKVGIISNPVYVTTTPNTSQNIITPYNPFTSNYGTYNSPNYNPYYNMQSSAFNTNYYANNYPYNNGFGYPGAAVTSFGSSYGIPINGAVPYVIGSTQQTYEYKEGTIVVDVVERKKNTLIWRGWGSNDITDPSAFENDLNKEIKAIFREYPVK